MKTSEIITMLNYPDTALVRFAVERANLTEMEWKVISMREYENHTIESAAEELDVSDSTVKRYYSQGMRKLDQCWSSNQWIRLLVIDQTKHIV